MIEDKIFRHYLDNINAYVNNKCGKRPDEKFMRKIEENIDIPEQSADDFRRMIMTFIGMLYYDRKEITWDSNPTLKKAIKKYVKEDLSRQQDIIDCYLGKQ